jgi:hypothetical protein
LSAFCAAYGQPAGRALDYEGYVGLVLNLERVSYRRSVEQARAQSALGGYDPLDEAWADAVALDAAEVEEILFNVNSERRLAKAKAKLGF